MGKARVAKGCAGTSRERGATVVEFAVVLPLLLFLLMGIFELGTLFWVQMTMQHAVREGARYAVTGQTDLDPDDHLRSTAITAKIKQSSVGLYDSVVEDMVVTDPDGHVLTNFGSPGQIIVIKLQCAWQLLTPLIRPFFADGTYSFTVSSTMRNENFNN